MSTFFRNKEIRILIIMLFSVSIVAIIVGFLLNMLTGMLILALCAIFCSIIIVYTLKRYKSIANLNSQLDSILHGNYELDFDSFAEGELSLLQSEIYKMTVMLRENSSILIKDKQYLSDSMADISHQLRTPLTSINMIIGFLGDKELSDERRTELIRDLNMLLARIDWLISTLLRISKIDAGTASFKNDVISVKSLIENTVELFLIPLELRNISVVMDSSSPNSEEAVTFVGDMSWSTEAISNIIKNCMEHTPDNGQIEISYSQNTIFTEIVIKDNGCGIDSEDIPRLFERFYQGKNASANSLGIGLALCRMIISKQNGTIKAENNPDVGARFTIKFYHQVI